MVFIVIVRDKAMVIAMIIIAFRNPMALPVERDSKRLIRRRNVLYFLVFNLVCW